MEWEENPIYKGRRPNDDTQEGHNQLCISLCLVSLLVVCLGLLCIVSLFAYALASQSSDNEATMVDTLASLHVPKASAPDITRPSEDRPLSPATITSEATQPNPGYIFPFHVPGSTECATPLCRSVAENMRATLDYSVNPCKDFYKYVCGKFRGEDVYSHVKASNRIATLTDLQAAIVPPSNQRPWQKAAAMFQACVSFASSYLPETIELVRWMISMNLDFYNTTRLAAVKPVEVMVRGSLDLGVDVMLAITFQKRNFIGNKRAAQIEFSKEQDTWLAKRSKNWYSTNKEDYAIYFLMSGIRRGQDYELAAKMLRYERRLQEITNAVRSRKEKAENMIIFKLGNYTTPHVTSDEWVSYFSKYTNGTYGRFDVILHQPHTTTILRKLFESEHVGVEGLRYLVAWSILRQLADFTEPYLFRGDRSATDTCYEHIKKVMNLAMISHFFEQEGSRLMVNQTESMVSQVQTAFRDTLLNSLWISYKEEVGAIRKFDDIVVNVGSPGRRLDPEFIDEHYKAYPDAPVNRLFPSWIKALSLSTHSIWSDQTTALYDENEVTARYIPDYNVVVVPTAIITRPFFYLDGPMALNYGGLGMIVAHELMHAFDVQSIDRESWVTDAFMKAYTERAICLRKSHKSVLSLSRRREILNDTVDSENLADLVGTRIAYTAFTSLSPEYEAEKLAGLNMSAKQLFFINHCAKWCAQHSIPGKRYAPFRSRCIVPLMNMPEFSWTFGCPAGAPMNPHNKCEFWF